VELDDRRFVVVGGAGVAGEAVAAGLLRRGATVAVTSRTEARLAAVRAVLDSPRLHGYVGGTSDLAGAEAVRDQIVAELGPVDGVVASLGGWWEGPPLTRLDPAVWHRILADNLTSHFIAARGYLPALVGRPDAVYVMLGGVGGALPLPHAGPVSVTGAAQTRLLEVLAAERTGVRLHEVRILTPVVTRHWDRPDREPDWLTGEQVGDYLAEVVSAGFPRAGRLVLPLPEP
jgi:NAD(P)-dependent dehydrogenase (short-subunit alcohol dehydrogenase family)